MDKQLSTLELMEQIEAVLILDVDHGIQDGDVSAMLASLADHIDAMDIFPSTKPNTQTIREFTYTTATRNQKLEMLANLEAWINE